MRPELKAPENVVGRVAVVGGEIGFNEAGAKSPGKRHAERGYGLGQGASMRPELKAPENCNSSSENWMPS